MKVKFTFEIRIVHKNSLALMGHDTHVFSITIPFAIARGEFLTQIYLYLFRNEKFAKGNSFEADFCYEQIK